MNIATWLVFMLTNAFCVFAMATNSNEGHSWPLLFSMNCPYTAQCKMNATTVLPENSRQGACCTSCSCHDDCLAMGNWCLDKRTPFLNAFKFSCKETLVRRKIENSNIDEEVYRGNDSGIKRYFIIDSCLVNINSDTGKRCSGSTNNSATLEDLVWVSDLNSGRIFKNIYCAKCRGVTNIIQWQVFTTCFDILLANISTVLPTLLSGLCSIIVDVPEKIAAATEKYRCFLPKYTRCNETGLWDNYDANLEKLCLGFSAPYIHPSIVRDDLYKNVFCYVCNQRHPAIIKKVCLLSDIKSATTRFSALLDHSRYTQPTTAEHECGIAEIMDKRTKICRGLNCPFPKTPFHGTCIQLSKNIFGLMVLINFKLTVLENLSAQNVNEIKFELGKEVHNAFSKSIGLKRANCLLYNMMVLLRQFESVETPLQFYILAHVYTTSRCQYDRITELVSAVLAKEIKITMPDKSILSFRVSIDKRTESQLQSVAEPLYTESKVINKKSIEYHVKSGMFCPQIEIDRSEMSSFVERTGKSERAVFEEGKMEEVSNRSIRICEDEYFAVFAQTSSAVRLLLAGSCRYFVLCCARYYTVDISKAPNCTTVGQTSD